MRELIFIAVAYVIFIVKLASIALNSKQMLKELFFEMRGNPLIIIINMQYCASGMHIYFRLCFALILWKAVLPVYIKHSTNISIICIS